MSEPVLYQTDLEADQAAPRTAQTVAEDVSGAAVHPVRRAEEDAEVVLDRGGDEVGVVRGHAARERLSRGRPANGVAGRGLCPRRLWRLPRSFSAKMKGAR